MTGGIIDLLPFVPGWEYRNYTIEGYVTRGGRPKETMISSYGWMFGVLAATTDAYATLKVTPLAKLQSPPLVLYGEIAKQYGSLAQDPGGWAQKYFRPLASSTWGAYITSFSPGFQGTLVPFIPSTKIEIYLQNGSTQTEAYIYGMATAIEIVDRHALLKAANDLTGPDKQAFLKALKDLRL